MASPETTAPESRLCSKCNETKVVTPQTWFYRKGKAGFYGPYGSTCLDCEKKRKADYEKRRDKIAAAVAKIPTAEAGKKPAKLDVNSALKVGGAVLNEAAPAVMARILEYLEDPTSDHHQWALELLAQRILPRKLYEELGGQAAGVGSLSDKRPQFVLNILPATGAPGQEPRVIEGQTIEVSTEPSEE